MKSNQLLFSSKNPIKEANSKEKEIFSFLNLYSLWLYRKNHLFQKAVSNPFNKNFPDGVIIAKKLKIKKYRGTYFTRNFLDSKKAKTSKHFFIGLDKKEIPLLSEKINIPEKNIQSYNPPFINNLEFSEEERNKMAKLINSFKTDYLWICVGNPKQEILAYQLFKNVKVKKIANIGAALDFILERKKEAPKFWINLGLEWLYLGFTNPKRTLKKIKYSLIALKYLNKGVIKE